MSMAPASRTTASAMAWTAGCEPTSALMAQASPPACLPAAWQAATVRAAASSLDRWLTTTVAPSRAKAVAMADRKSTRLNSSHLVISYAVFCLKKKKKKQTIDYCTTDSDFADISEQ